MEPHDLCVTQPSHLRQWVRVLLFLAVSALLLSVSGCNATTTRPGDATAATPPLLDSAVDFAGTVLDELPPATGYRIGLQTEVTGDGATIGDLTIRAARLAVEEINAAGGINGAPLELVVRDVRSDPALALQEYRAALVEDNLVALLGPFKSAYAVEIVPEHLDADLPMFIGATNAMLTAQGDRNLFRMRPSDKVTAAAMTAFATDSLGAQRIGVVHDTDAFGSGGAQRIAQELAARGLTPAVQLGYTTGASGFDSIAFSLAQSDVDAVLVYATNGTDVGRLLRSIRYWNVNVPIITSPSGATVPARNIAADAQDGIYVVVDAVLDATAEGARFRDAFRARFGLEPDTYATWTYDAVHLLAARLAAAPHASGAALSAAIRSAPFTGAQGVYRFDAAGDGLHAATLVRMRNGRAQPLGAYADGQLRLSAVREATQP